ncbi:GOLPH3/VPS74 family protein [Paenibacillus mendelii]|uniref:GPP34 family phosphoprotein n=1 Tax=Paenibacillus mendelii TaxID=206163 RepID=A0ABV6J432_9BACL|nr:GPP34 family phosphoprotein [Paenibacillus mendelii]MCQ6561862.1 GPP34 family phosphoprotein [Paenibacillus mendelii]
MQNDYGLAQEFAIVASDSPPRYRHALSRNYLELYTVGAAIIELVLEGYIHWGEKGYLEAAVDGSSTGSKGKDLLVEEIGAARRPKMLKGWIGHYYNRASKRRIVFEMLVETALEEGAIHTETYKLLRMLPVTKYVASREEKDRIVRLLREGLLEQGAVNERTAALAMLLDTAKLLKHYFSNYEQQKLKGSLERVQAKQSDEWQRIGQIRKAIQEIESSTSFVVPQRLEG